VPGGRRYPRGVRRWTLLCSSLALTVLVLPVLAAPVQRRRVVSGQSTTHRIDRPGEFQEFVLAAARGSKIRVLLGKAGARSCNPIGGVLDGNYSPVPLLGTSVTNFGTPLPLTRSGDVRVLTAGANGTVGSYKVKATIKPAKSFKVSAKVRSLAADPYPQTSLTFGAYPGFTFTVKIGWKGPSPVTLDAVTGPGGEELVTNDPAKRRKQSVKRAGFSVQAFGDHHVRVNVPAGTKKWTISVKLAGKLDKGDAVDARLPHPGPDGVRVVSAVAVPLVQVVTENGGPNDFAVAGQDGLPIAVFSDRRSGGCARATVELDPATATAYEMRCVNGYLALVEGVVRDENDNVLGFELPLLRSPAGSGSATISGVVYDQARKPLGWTEVRHFPATGNTHTLVFSEIERYTNIDQHRIQFSFESDEALLEIDEPIVAGTLFTDAVITLTPDRFLRQGILPGDFLQFVVEPDQLNRKTAHVVTRNVRPLRILEVTDFSLTLEEPLVDETPPPGARFSYRILRRTDFVRSFTVTHTDPAGVTRAYHDAGGRVR